MADPLPVLWGEPQVGGEGLAVRQQALGGGGELAFVAAGEGVDAGLCGADGRLAGFDVLGQVEDRPEGG